MPLLIFHCRIRLSLAIIQQWTMLGGAPTLRLQVQPMNFTLISHHAFQHITKLNYLKVKSSFNDSSYYKRAINLFFIKKKIKTKK